MHNPARQQMYGDLLFFPLMVFVARKSDAGLTPNTGYAYFINSQKHGQCEANSMCKANILS